MKNISNLFTRSCRLCALLLCAAGVLSLSACAGGGKDKNAKVPTGLTRLEDSLSLLYSNLQSEHEKAVEPQADRLAAGDTSSPTPPAADPSQRNYARLKDIYKQWNETLPQLQNAGVPEEMLSELESTLNHMGVYVDGQSYAHASEQLNESLRIISDIYEQRGLPVWSQVLKLEYHINRISLHAGDPEALRGAVDALGQTVASLQAMQLAPLSERLEKIALNIDSVRNAAALGDAQLISLKNALLREESRGLQKIAKSLDE